MRGEVRAGGHAVRGEVWAGGREGVGRRRRVRADLLCSGRGGRCLGLRPAVHQELEAGNLPRQRRPVRVQVRVGVRVRVRVR
eukprot:scaffold65786_cov39-Phaeocystis_antarctica.AAC.1